MYSFIKLNSRAQSRVKTGFVIIVFIIITIGWFLNALDLTANSMLIEYNTLSVEHDEGKVKVSYINNEDRVFLEDGTSVTGSAVTDYVRTVKGTGTYKLSSGEMSAEITEDIVSSLPKASILFEVCMLGIITVMILKAKKWWQKVLVWVFLVVQSLISLATFGIYIGFVLLKYEWLLYTLFAVKLIAFIIITIVIIVKERKKGHEDKKC